MTLARGLGARCLDLLKLPPCSSSKYTSMCMRLEWGLPTASPGVGKRPCPDFGPPSVLTYLLSSAEQVQAPESGDTGRERCPHTPPIFMQHLIHNLILPTRCGPLGTSSWTCRERGARSTVERAGAEANSQGPLQPCSQLVCNGICLH